MRLALLLVAALPAFAHDWLIVPGERVGPITAHSSEASLRAAFGNAAILHAEIHLDKKTTVPGVEIYPGRPGESLAVVWPRKEDGLWWPLLVIPCYGSTGTECRWRTASGVRVGVSVADLEKLNEKPFLLYPSSDRQSWTEPWWNDGKLAQQLGEDIELYCEDPDFQKAIGEFDVTQVYMQSNHTALTGRGLRIDQLLVFLLSGRRTAPANDWIIVPGERVGSIPIHAAAEPLRETFGPAQVHRVLADADEGIGNTPGISIFGGQKGREVLLRRDGNQICGGIDGYKACEWHIAGGIPLTTTVEAMERLNGRPFLFNGCCCDVGGIVRSWEGGRLDKRLHRRLPVLAVYCEGQQPERLSGDSVRIRSDDPDIRRQKCTVNVIDF
jgi:hypothetical protein